MTVNLTANGTPTHQAGKFGNALGSTTAGFYQAPTGTFSATGSTGTWEMWVTYTGAATILVALGDGGQMWLGQNSSGFPSFSWAGGALAGTTRLNDGNFHHVAVTMDGTTIALYIDGARAATSAQSTSTFNTQSTGRWAIGAFGTSGFRWSGVIDEVRVSSVARYSGTTYTVPTGPFTGDGNTLGLYHLETDGTDSTSVAADTTAPTTPGTPTAAAGTGTATVTFTASTDDVAVAGYRVYTSADTYTAVAATGTASPITVTGLTAGTAYTFEVAAYDAAGNVSPKSAASNSVTPTAAVPGAPTGLAATAGNAQAALSWTAPASTGGAVISDYLIEYQPSGGAWTTFTHTAQTTTTITVTGLTNGTAYTFRVSAVNSVGTGTASGTATATPQLPNTAVAPNDTNIVYSPYNWLVTASTATTATPGAYLRTTIQGTPTSIVANFDMTNVTSYAPQVAITVDGLATTLVQIASTVTIAIPAGTSWTKHVIEIVFKQANQYDNRWNVPLTGAIYFKGFTIAPGTTSTTTTRRAPYNILCFGDSITEGIFTNSGGDGDSRNAWAYPLRQLLGAEVGVVGYGGSGLSGGGNGNVPVWSTVYNQLWNGQARTFTTPAEPNLVLINLGTNGFNQANATTMLNGILAATTNTKIVVVQQWKDASNKTAWQAAIAATTAPARVTYLDTTGWLNTADAGDGLHPWGYINITDLAPRVATSVLPLLNGATVTTGGGAGVTPKRFVNVAGTAKAIA